MEEQTPTEPRTADTQKRPGNIPVHLGDSRRYSIYIPEGNRSSGWTLFENPTTSSPPSILLAHPSEENNPQLYHLYPQSFPAATKVYTAHPLKQKQTLVQS